MKYLPVATTIVVLFGGVVFFVARQPEPVAKPNAASATAEEPTEVIPPRREPMSDEEWEKVLTEQQFSIIRQEGTERPFSSPLAHETRPGTYYSADCGVALFRSEQKYDSGTGWPSFWAPISDDVLTLVEDRSLPFAPRVEVRDAACDGHLGHVFEDGPPPTGKRYCMNGVALIFVPDATEEVSP